MVADDSTDTTPGVPDEIADTHSQRRNANAAIEQAAERSQVTATRNVTNLPGLPVEDTANLRHGPDLHQGLLALLPLVGVWRGTGEGHGPDGGYTFGQQISISHDGQNYLTWESRSWVTDENGTFVRPDLREAGFWRINEADQIEFLLTHASGVIELYYGHPISTTAFELATDVVIRSESGVLVGGAKRLYGLVEDGDLAYVEERIDADGDLTPHLSAKLSRWAG